MRTTLEDRDHLQEWYREAKQQKNEIYQKTLHQRAKKPARRPWTKEEARRYLEKQLEEDLRHKRLSWQEYKYWRAFAGFEECPIIGALAATNPNGLLGVDFMTWLKARKLLDRCQTEAKTIL